MTAKKGAPSRTLAITLPSRSRSAANGGQHPGSTERLGNVVWVN